MKNSFLKSDPDITRGTDKSCLDCQKKFSIMVREHQCKRCLKPVCSECGSYRRQVYIANFVLRDHRVCKGCKSASQEISNYVKNQDLRFASMSDIGKKWLKKITKKPSTFGTDVSQHKQFTRQYFGQLWGSYSFELRQLMGILTFKIQQDGIYSVVYGVYTTVISAAPQYKLPQVIHLIVFVLCFCDADKVPFIVLYLLQLKQHQKDIKEVAYKYLKALPFTTELAKLQEIINYRLERFADSFMVNCLTIDMSIYLINRVLQRRNIEEMFIIFATHIYINREMLLSKYKEDKLLLNNLMLRKCLQPSQLIANAKFFKGKQFTISNQESSDSFGYLSLRKAQTLNLDVELSPNNSLVDTYDIKIQPAFVNRSSAQLKNSKDNIEDSFSMYLEANDKENTSLKLSPSSPSIKDGKNVLESMQYSPQSRSIENIMDSPFRKTAAEDFGEDLPQLMELSKTTRKNTDGPDISQVRNCEKCSFYHQEMQTMLKKIRQEKDKWVKQKQAYELSKENMSENVNKLVEENFTIKTKVKELEAVNSQHQNQIKMLLQKLKVSQEEVVKKNELLLQMKEEKKQLNERLMKQSNENIKLYALVEQEKRCSNQAKEMSAQAGKNTEGMKIKLKQSQQNVQELKKKTASLANELHQLESKDRKRQKDAQQLKNEVVEMKERNNTLERTISRMEQKAKGQPKEVEGEKITIAQDRQIKRLKQQKKAQQTCMNELNIKIKGLESDNKQLRKDYQILLKSYDDSVLSVNRIRTIYEDQIREKQLMKRLKQQYEKSTEKAKESNRIQLVLIRHEIDQEKAKVNQLLEKMREISQLMMEIQAEKMEMADQLFSINVFLKQKGLAFA